MQLTQFADYSLRVLMHLAYRADELRTIGEIAADHGISENHLMKVVHRLARLGYIETMCGRGGGLRLARPPERIRVGEVVRDVEETLAPVECLVAEHHSNCRLRPSCRLQSLLRDAQQAFMQHLDGYTLRDLPGTRAPPALATLPLLWVLHLAYAWIPLHLALRAAAEAGWVMRPLAGHARPMGAIGGLTIGMMVRTARGHTGLALRSDGIETTCFVLVAFAAVVRVICPLLAPQHCLATVEWSAAFLLLAVRYWPILTRPRVDGAPGRNGAGGPGSPAAISIAAAGVGHRGILDHGVGVTRLPLRLEFQCARSARGLEPLGRHRRRLPDPATAGACACAWIEPPGDGL